MAVSEIPGGPKPVSHAKDDRTRQADRAREDAPESGDRVNLSSEARSLYEASKDSRLDEIRERVRSGFYARHDVTEKVVEEILKDLREGH